MLIVGAGQVAERFADALELNPSYGLHPIGLLDDCVEESLSRPVLGGIDQLDSVLSDHRIDRVVIAFGVNRDPDLVRVIRSCETRRSGHVHHPPLLRAGPAGGTA